MGVLKGVDCSKVKRVKTHESTGGPNVVRCGVSYKGRCASKDCSAVGGDVVCNRGKGCFVVNDDVMSEKVLCPACQRPFELVNICLYQCKAKVTIVGHDDQSEDYEASGDDVVLLGGPVAPKNFQPGALVTVETLKPKQCSVM